MQLFVVGEIIGLTGINSAGAHCNWTLVAPTKYVHVAGETSGASQSDMPGPGETMYVFQHPVDASYETEADDLTTVGAPHIEIEVRTRDSDGRSDMGGYAVVHLPMMPGVHEISCCVWKPRGSMGDRFAASFVGGAPQLKDTALRYGVEEEGTGEIGTRLSRSKGSQRMATAPGGEVHLRLSVCFKRGMSGVARSLGADDPPDED